MNWTDGSRRVRAPIASTANWLGNPPGGDDELERTWRGGVRLCAYSREELIGLTDQLARFGCKECPCLGQTGLRAAAVKE